MVAWKHAAALHLSTDKDSTCLDALRTKLPRGVNFSKILQMEVKAVYGVDLHQRPEDALRRYGCPAACGPNMISMRRSRTIPGMLPELEKGSGPNESSKSHDHLSYQPAV